MSSPSRQDDEHRLARVVADWISARAQKADAIHDHNEVIKKLEESIEQLSRSIQGGQYQPNLPFEEAGKPTVTLAESDPDAQAAKEEAKADATRGSCATCGHLRTYHRDEDDKTPVPCWQPDCDCEAFIATPRRRSSNTDDVCLCGDLRSDHRDASGCDSCDCAEFRDSDPLGVAHVEPEKQEAEL